MIARQVSRPIRSASASGPIGMVHTQLHHRVDVFAFPHPMIEAVNRFVDHRHEDPVSDETQDNRWLRPAFCRIFQISSQVSLNVSSDVAMPRMTSTSFISGTGFMKCIPMTLSGRPV